MPTATRTGRPGWKDTRLWVGVLLLAGSVVLGARVVGGADDSVAVWAARSDLAPGAVVTAEELVLTRIRFTDPAAEGRYYEEADTLPAEAVLRQPVGAGDLLPRTALTGAVRVDQQISVSVPAAQVPPSVRAGVEVDVWVLPGPGSAGAEKATLALSGVTVIDALSPASGFSGAATDRQLVLGMPEDESGVARILAASGQGRLMIVARG